MVDHEHAVPSSPPSPSWGSGVDGFGRVLGAADTACALSMRMKPGIPSLKFFGRGWGNLNNVEEQKTWMNSFVADHHAGRLPALDVKEVGNARKTSSSIVRQCVFESPMAAALPLESHECHFELVIPAHGKVRACVLILPGTGDSTYAFRRLTLAEPLSQVGVACIIPMPAYVGNRRPADQWLHYVPTVEALCLQSQAVTAEGLALLGWARTKFSGALLGVTGMSWGGGMAGCIGCVARGYDLAMIPCLTSSGPDVLIKGVLRCELAFEQLVSEGSTLEQTEQELLDFLGDIKPSTLIEMGVSAVPGPGGIKIVTQVQAAHDGFVPAASGLDNFRQIRVLDDNAELIWVPGGHVSSFAAARRISLDHILSALLRLEAALKLAGSTQSSGWSKL